MTDTKSGTISSVFDYSEKKLHVPEFTAAAVQDLHRFISDKSPMAEQIRKYRKAAKISQQSLADALGVTRNSVINWEAGRYRPDADLFPQLCSLLGITLNDLFGISTCSTDSFSLQEQNMIRNYRLISPVSQRIVSRMIENILEEETDERNRILQNGSALVGELSTAAAAGDGFEFSDIPMEGCRFVFRNERNEKANAIIRVKGSSMTPVYMDDDRVYVQFTSTAEIGEDVICSSRQGLHIKRLGENGPYSVNSKEPFALTSEDDHVQIVGRVLGIVDPSSDFPSAAENDILMNIRNEEVRHFMKKHGLES